MELTRLARVRVSVSGAFRVRVLFVTSEFDDLVRVGGLAAVTAALPRALQALTDVRVFIPGYREVLAGLKDVQLVGRCPAFAQLPECSVLRTETADGLPIYVVECQALYDREGGPYGDFSMGGTGMTMPFDLLDSHRRQHYWHVEMWIKTGKLTFSIATTGNPPSRRPI